MFFNNLKSTIMTIMNVIVREYSKIVEKKFRYEFVDPELSPFTSSLIVDRGIAAVNHEKRCNKCISSSFYLSFFHVHPLLSFSNRFSIKTHNMIKLNGPSLSTIFIIIFVF